VVHVEYEKKPNGAGRLSQLLHSTWGALLVIFAAAVAGGVVQARLGNQAQLPEKVAALETITETHTDSVNAISRRSVWIICTTVPPNRPDVLAALEVNCRFVAELPRIEIGAQ